VPPDRKTVQESTKTQEFDILVIGGGATGSGVALDAATRGLKVALVQYMCVCARAGASERVMMRRALTCLQETKIGVGGGGGMGSFLICWGGFRVFACIAFAWQQVEQEDFASGTSSRSTKLIHGGIRYLALAFQVIRDPLQRCMLIPKPLLGIR